jgi:hypothetical protein
VNHPPENAGNELSAGGFTFWLIANGTGQSEAGRWAEQLIAPIVRRLAQIHMLMPLRDAQGHALV